MRVPRRGAMTTNCEAGVDLYCISWTLVRAGVDIGAVPLPSHGRAPGWAAGVVVARRGGEG
jgi:hypothetical protein